MNETSGPAQKLTLHELRTRVGELNELRGNEQKAALQLLTDAYREASGGQIAELCHLIGEWRRSKKFRTDWLNVAEKLMLTVTELSEAMEAYRHLPEPVLKCLADGGLPSSSELPPSGEWCVWAKNFEEELADTFIRLADLCNGLGIDLFANVCRKMARNELRPTKHGKEC